ncbi:MAG: type II toxin-antitoxin system VapC family toxin [Cyanobium sp.]
MIAQEQGLYLDTCVLVSLLHGDAGYPAAEAWLSDLDHETLWISHWVLLEFTSATAVRLRRGELARERAEPVRATLQLFCQERLGMLEPRGEDFLRAQRWLEEAPASGLKGADALHLAIAHRHRLALITADQTLIRAAKALRIAVQPIAST